MRMIDDIPVWGDPVDAGALEQIQRCAKVGPVAWAAMMADHHLGDRKSVV